HTRFSRDWSADVCSSDLGAVQVLNTTYMVAPPFTSGSGAHVHGKPDSARRSRSSPVQQHPKIRQEHAIGGQPVDVGQLVSRDPPQGPVLQRAWPAPVDQPDLE